MKKLGNICAVAVAVALMGCSVENAGPTGKIVERHLTIRAVRGDGSDTDTRTMRDDEGTVYWCKDDQISLFYGDGDEGGSVFTSTQEEDLVQVTNFTGTISVDTDEEDGETYYWGLYPFLETASCDGTSVTTTLPSTQTAYAGSFASETQISLGRTQGLEDDLLMGFYNVTGSIRLSVSKEGVRKATLKGNDGELLAGTLKITFEGDRPSTEIIDGKDEIVLEAPDGEYFEPGEYYYFVIAPTTFGNGFTVTVETLTEEATYKYSKSVSVLRSKCVSKTGLDAKLTWGPKSGNIPVEDANFKAYLVDNFDTDKDGEISYSEAAAIKTIYVSTDNIESLQGTEYMVNLQGLSCFGSTFSKGHGSGILKALDISNNYALRYLECGRNQLTSLDVSQCANLRHLSCDDNQLSDIDISNNISLNWFSCCTNQLTEIDVSANTALTHFYCHGNQISYLDLSNIPDLVELGCGENPISDLDLSNNTALESLECSSCQLTNLDISKNTALQYLSCEDNHLTNIDVSNNTSLIVLSVYNNQLTSLDVSKNTALINLCCSPMEVDGENVLKTLYIAQDQEIPNVAPDTERNSAYIPDGTDIVVKPDKEVIPVEDANFKAYLVENFDTDNDGEISYDEALAITSINVSTDDIESVQGIEYMTNLRVLNCSGSMVFKNAQAVGMGRLTDIDVSSNTMLRTLTLQCNQLTSLDISQNVKLTSLSCFLNQLSCIDISQNTELTLLNCASNQLSSLDISNNTVLETLYCGANLLTNLNVSNNLGLSILTCGYNRLTSLDVAKNTALTKLQCPSNQLTSLDVSTNSQLTWLDCYENNLTILDVSKNTALTILDCSPMDVDGNNALSTLYVLQGQAIPNVTTDRSSDYIPDGTDIVPIIPIEDANFKAYLVENFDTDSDGIISYDEAQAITSINVCTDDIESVQGIEYMTNLKRLSCSGTNRFSGLLETIDVSNNTELVYLQCAHNHLTNLDVSKNTALTQLTCSYNQLSCLDVSQNVELIELYCNDNQLSSLEVSSNQALQNLSCGFNQLTSLDVSTNTMLTDLSCGYSRISSLDVSKNVTLTKLNCQANQLSHLDVSKNTKLTRLFCDTNQLTSLDISNNIALYYLKCDNNQLTSLDVSNNAALTTLDCAPMDDVDGNNVLEVLYIYDGQVIPDVTPETDRNSAYIPEETEIRVVSSEGSD